MKIQRICSDERFIDSARTMAARRPSCNAEVARTRAARSDRDVARRLSVDDAVDVFLDHLKVERHLSVHTLDGYGRDLARLGRLLAERGRRTIDDVTAADVTDHLIALADAKLAPRSRARALVAIRGLFRHLVAERWLDADPTEHAGAPRSAPPLPDVLGVDAVARLVDAPGESPRGLRDAAMIELAYASGLRVSELVAL